MFWVVQEDLFIENRRYDLVQALERMGIPYALVKAASGEISPVVDADGPIITNGSIALSNIAITRGWKPGSLFNENFSYEVWKPYFSEWLLNRDAIFTTLGEIDITSDKAFVRPLLDDKSFTGKVMSRDEIDRMRDDATAGVPNSFSPAMKVLIATPKRIGQEHRHYIVDGEVVTSSRYKLSGTVNYSEGADTDVVNFAERMAAIWSPARAFVLDTYVAGDEIGIVEMGCICHAGLYQADVMKYVAALDSMAA